MLAFILVCLYFAGLKSGYNFSKFCEFIKSFHIFFDCNFGYHCIVLVMFIKIKALMVHMLLKLFPLKLDITVKWAWDNDFLAFLFQMGK